MASFLGQYWKSVWKRVLQVGGTTNAGISASLQTIQDGEGSSTALQLSTTSVKSTGTLVADGTVTGSNLSGTHSGTSSGTNTGDQTITLTGDVTGAGTGSFATTLANSGVSANTYGSSTAIPVITVDAKGRLTTVTTAVPQGSGLLGVQVFASGSGTYTPVSGMGRIIVEMVGGGGGGGGVSNADAYAVANGGNAGTYMKFLMTAAQVGASKSYTVGAAANGGVAGNNAGTAGNSTTFADWVAAGGRAGAGMAGTTAPQVSAAPTANAASTTGTGTSIMQISGALSTCGFAIATPLGSQSFGGKSYLAGRNNDATNVRDDRFLVAAATVTGQNGSPNVGNGGHGAISVNNAGNAAGGNGTTGYIIVYEFA